MMIKLLICYTYHELSLGRYINARYNTQLKKTHRYYYISHIEDLSFLSQIKI